MLSQVSGPSNLKSASSTSRTPKTGLGSIKFADMALPVRRGLSFCAPELSMIAEQQRDAEANGDHRQQHAARAKEPEAYSARHWAAD